MGGYDNLRVGEALYRKDIFLICTSKQANNKDSNNMTLNKIRF